MPNDERLRLLLDADLSSHALLRILSEELGHDVVAAGLDVSLKQLDDRLLFAVAQEERRIVITHNRHDFPDILREWAEARRSHYGCIVSAIPTNEYGKMQRRLAGWFRQLPSQQDWIDRAVFL